MSSPFAGFGLAFVLVYCFALVTYTLVPLPIVDAAYCAAHASLRHPVWNPVQFLSDMRQFDTGLLDNPALRQVLFNVALFVPWGVVARRFLGWSRDKGEPAGRTAPSAAEEHSRVMSFFREVLPVAPGRLALVYEDTERCVRAVQSKDERFDGWFFTAVVTTGIYCRPSCPVVPPKVENMRFHPSAAAAQAAGFRACKRCRPNASPGSPLWNERADLVARAMRLIADGVVDREGVTGLAARLGYSVRQVERQVYAELGAGPLALARAQRAETARLLVETTKMPMGDVAHAAGFASLRTFNDTVRAVFALTPSELRSRAKGAEQASPGGLSLRLPFRKPLCPDNLFGHLAATAVPGVEEWRDGAYRRTLRLPHGHGVVSLRPTPDHIACRLNLTDLRDLAAATSRCRWLLDLDADPVAVDEQLAADPELAPLVAKSPGRRVPRTTDPDEFAVRAVLGQQVSTAAARTHAARLVLTHGTAIEDREGGLTHLFPLPEDLAGLDPEALAMPKSRRSTLLGLLDALTSGEVDLTVGGDWDRARAQLAGLRGFGPWTVETIAMRALGDPDAFVATDLGIKLAAEALGLPVKPAGLIERAESWRPWRAYAVQYLWATGDHAVNRIPA